MTRLISWMSLILSVIPFITLTSCGDDDSDNWNTLENITGTWYGIRFYNNGSKEQNLDITFENDGTGYLTYNSPVSFSAAAFTYYIKKDKIYCDGAYASSYGDLDDEFNMTIRVEIDRLYVENVFPYFVLTKDGSIETDGEGNVVINQYDDLIGVWIDENSGVILILYSNNTWEEYDFDSSDKSTYTGHDSGNFSYDYRNKSITLGSETYTISVLSDDYFSIIRSGKVFNFTKGSNADVPTSADLKSFLRSHYAWSASNGKYSFMFTKFDTVVYMEVSDVKIGSYGYPSLSAQGPFSISGNTVTCNYEKVYWEYGNYSEYKNLFSGWEYNKSRTLKYEMSATSSGELKVVFPDGKTLYFKGVN